MSDSDDVPVEQAIATPDEKLSPGEVPVCTFLAAMKTPQTDGREMLVFDAGEDVGTVGVRLEAGEAEAMMQQLQAVTR